MACKDPPTDSKLIAVADGRVPVSAASHVTHLKTTQRRMIERPDLVGPRERIVQRVWRWSLTRTLTWVH